MRKGLLAMLKLLFLLIVVFLAAVLTVMVILYRALGWWAIPLTLALFVGLLFFLKASVRYIAEKLFAAPFRMKGAVLKAAKVQIHSVTPCEPPAGMAAGKQAGGEAGKGQEPAGQAPPKAAETQWYWIDLTVTPKPATGQFTHWEPGELHLVAGDTMPGEPLADHDWGSVAGLEIQQGGAFRKEEGLKYAGEQRLRVQVDVPKDLRQAKVAYYFEVLDGVIDLELAAELTGRRE